MACHARLSPFVGVGAGLTSPVGIWKDGGHDMVVLGVESWRCERRRRKSCMWTGLIHRDEDSTKSGQRQKMYKKTFPVDKPIGASPRRYYEDGISTNGII